MNDNGWLLRRSFLTLIKIIVLWGNITSEWKEMNKKDVFLKLVCNQFAISLVVGFQNSQNSSSWVEEFEERSEEQGYSINKCTQHSFIATLLTDILNIGTPKNVLRMIGPKTCL
jgi:hypothetical protein